MMCGLSVKFSFGAAVCRGQKSLRDLEGQYQSKCLGAAQWMTFTPVTSPGHGWLNLPSIDTSEIKEAGEWLRGYDFIVHAGIGGSALGTLMLNQALLDFYPSRGPRLFVADNPDPSKTRAIWEKVKYGRTALVGVSKSGATAETMSQFLWFRERMIEKGQSDADIMVITDLEYGVFRSFANASGCRSLPLPASVGGRYSVLSAASLVGAYALGINIDSLLSGAAEMKAFLSSKKDIWRNPAWMLAALSCFHWREGRPMSVMMPYSSRLAYFAEWYAQLWGESLGKDGKGTTPVRALGAIDQHSQVQLYADGPDDKFITIINVRDHGECVTVPYVSESSLASLDYMGGSEIGRMLWLEAMSTAAALAKSEHPVAWIEIERIDAKTVGALIFFYEYVTAMTGRIMGLNPFDQPGVEQGKRYTYGLMGRDGYEKEADEAKMWFSRIESCTEII